MVLLKLIRWKFTVNYNIRAMAGEDKSEILEMMSIFYSSDAVYTNGSPEIFLNDVENCVNDNPYLDGFVIENGKEIIGYLMAAFPVK